MRSLALVNSVGEARFPERPFNPLSPFLASLGDKRVSSLVLWAAPILNLPFTAVFPSGLVWVPAWLTDLPLLSDESFWKSSKSCYKISRCSRRFFFLSIYGNLNKYILFYLFTLTHWWSSNRHAPSRPFRLHATTWACTWSRRHISSVTRTSRWEILSKTAD